MRRFLILFLLFISYLLFSQEEEFRGIAFDNRVFDPFFAITVIDSEGELFNISRAVFYDEFNDKKFFFWVRRNSGLYNLSFKNIKKITFTGEELANETYKNFTKCSILLVTGESYDMFIKTTGHIEGWDETFASPVSLYLHYNLIESITFNHSGEYDICPFCSTIYFDNKTDSCLYDKTPLIRGVFLDSVK